MIKRKALSPVISSLILSAAVIAIGGGLWSYSAGAATVIADSYVNDTLELVNEVTERFVVEHVTIDAEKDTLSVWVYNYGSQKINVDVYVKDGDTVIGSTLGTVIDKGDTSGIPIEITVRASDDEVSIKVHSRRQNNAYETYYVP
ncbi:MAG: hypothetical protein ACEROO_12180 [Candidatus Bathyarchaeota archaeon]